MYYASVTDVGEKTTVDVLKMDVHSPSKVGAKHKPVYVCVCMCVFVCGSVLAVYTCVCVLCMLQLHLLYFPLNKMRYIY